MPIRVALNHQTHYRYDRLVRLLPQIVRLRPAPHCRTPVLSYSLTIQPRPQFLNWQQDPYSNYRARLVFSEPVRELHVEVDLVAELTAINPFDFFAESGAEFSPFTYEPTLARELVPYLEVLPAGPKAEALANELRRDRVRTVDHLVAINRCVQREVRYIIRMEPGVQEPEQTLTLGRGSCRDSAWLLVQLLRRLGLAARFVSGYLIQLRADVPSLDGPSGPERDFTDLHAWAEVYIPGAGWIGLDPTSGLLASEGHLPLACSADPVGAAPITGAIEWTRDPRRKEEDECPTDFHVTMSVTRLQEDPRVTRPYSDAQWQAIEAVGLLVDDALRAGDVRLTMGGEPTFVSIDDRDAAEWNTLPLGPAKRRQGGVLLRRLRDRLAPGALLHFGQGKWYPGEPLPRWALGCYWRRDSVPVWQDRALIAEDDRDLGHGEAEAHRFVIALAERLGVPAEYGIPGFEDVLYYLWREQQLPINVDPLDNRLEDPRERARLTRLFEQGLGRVVGYTLPLRREGDAAKSWVSSRWTLRRGRLFLIAGDSPMGYRLPLDSLPWEDPKIRETPHPVDPTAPRGPLPPHPARIAAQHRGVSGNGQAPTPATKTEQPPPGVIRTALCVEPREGRLHVFLPPQPCLEDFLDLVAAIEATAAALNLPLQVEGYPPPPDHRLVHFKVTPDPGVLEVNVPPSHDWDELVRTTTVLYDEARQARLSAEKFMLDGRHTPTGGGNHIVIGGPTPVDSPLLRRPDLLRSLLGFWHNHPALSYLFSGLFIGPTSQAPRVDEARNDSLYELELALRQIGDPDREAMPVLPWLVDRLFRHLLVDVTGNTHRAEFCIDKLYTPDSSSDRRGLLELRAFEMPPHPRMRLVQQLLLRALIARFWNDPYTVPLARWGTELHDRFMLPHFVGQDFDDVLHDLRRAGFPLEASWFAPHFEFRFPAFGTICQRGVHLELRQALEPWHVLGEEPSAGGPVRYVDSSVERLQVRVTGMTGTRHVVLCNGRRVPLHPTGVTGEFVAGVRYRAWQPPSCLHPTIPIHAPLVFDLFDTWLGRSLGGCTYHVAHPGGRAFETFPVNASEAEGRRIARFFAFGHSPGPRVVPPEERCPECPLTLDLRRPLLPSASAGAASSLENQGRPRDIIPEVHPRPDLSLAELSPRR
jgi:uncharacterized protein (DUF2126 family)/transglutaminase-like putative cysteine protease